MEWIKIVIQLVIAVSIFNVWIVRFAKPTRWRGGEAKSMKEEFEIYSLPQWFMRLIGFIKLTLAALLITGIFLSALVKPAAFGMAVLMLGAVSMHIKVKDTLIKSFPALILLVMSVILIIF